MRLQIISIGALLAAAAASTGAATAPSDAAAQQLYEFCVSGAAKEDGRVYISPVFPVALHDVRGEFAQHLVAAYGYKGDPVRCYSLAPESQVESFRMQVIEIFHWRGEHDILPIDWTPVAGATLAAPPQATRDSEPTSTP